MIQGNSLIDEWSSRNRCNFVANVTLQQNVEGIEKKTRRKVRTDVHKLTPTKFVILLMIQICLLG